MSKKARSEAARVASLIRANKAEYYIADIELDDSTEIVATVELVNKTLGKWKCAFMLIYANATSLTTAVYVPSEFQHKIDMNDWQDAIESVNPGQYAIWSDRSVRELKSDDAFKLKDAVRAVGFKYLKDRGCLGEDDSSDDFTLNNLDDL